jgi:hypothetical protein
MALLNSKKETKFTLENLEENTTNNCINIIPIHGSFEMILE